MRNVLLHPLSAGLFPLLITACSTTSAGGPAERKVDDGDSFKMAAGERVQLAQGDTLRYLRVDSDSRCPPDVRCVWAGDAEVVFEWTRSGGTPEPFTLHTGLGDRSKSLGARMITLESLARGEQPIAQLSIASRTPSP